ncbi:anthranilate synthase component 1 (plasmid) [Buchnera aphidicola (Thelaxes californica)]|uniref:Anthranilate synthase component 1 n=1 Tax=Buchnera aphidicola (Thelaxes californica) TaxID=1315998 RepID=A0A4D6YFU0_9GAMM|nr:anthranilate synthase component 1 [Buchnera aphidicola]QCI27013.1 anthranilate synthase component 1 [Buchnera aphidicola (Thelaxes californica)]
MKNQKYEIELIKDYAEYHSDPTLIFHTLCESKPYTLLLESAEINTRKNVESMLIVDTALKITAQDLTVTFDCFTTNGKALLPVLDFIFSPHVEIFSYPNGRKYKFPESKKNIDEDKKIRTLSIFDSLRFLLRVIKPIKNEPKAIFLGGFFSYDLVSTFEKIPKLINKQNCPDFCFYLAETLLTLDHQKKKCIIQSTLFKNNIAEKARLKNKILEIKKKISTVSFRKFTIKKEQIYNTKNVNINKNDNEYIKIINDMKKFILKGDIFQIVPSRKFFTSCIDPLVSYQILKKNNPSPYMFFMQDIRFNLFGASPESSLKFNPENRKVEIYPIAGTRPRGINKNNKIDLDLDSKIELEMRTNEKEMSEHIMLVDLARNDLARICIPGTRSVSDLTKVDKYSHVMHLVSNIYGKLLPDLDALHAYQACMNMGTLTGAPKIKAMQLIAQFEGERRGSYGGAIGYLTASGEFDTCIIIRSAYVENGIATVQSGAGIILDSIPQMEADESRDKAQAVLHSIMTANQILKEIKKGRGDGKYTIYR